MKMIAFALLLASSLFAQPDPTGLRQILGVEPICGYCPPSAKLYSGMVPIWLKVSLDTEAEARGFCVTSIDLKNHIVRCVPWWPCSGTWRFSWKATLRPGETVQIKMLSRGRWLPASTRADSSVLLPFTGKCGSGRSYTFQISIRHPRNGLVRYWYGFVGVRCGVACPASPW